MSNKRRQQKQHNRAVVHRTRHIYSASFSVFSEVPSSAQTRVNKAFDGMSAREVWSRAGLRATALCGTARLRHSLPSCQVLLPKTHQPCLILPRSPPPPCPCSTPSVALEKEFFSAISLPKLS